MNGDDLEHPGSSNAPKIDSNATSGYVDRPPKGPRIDWDEAKRLYESEGWTIARIADHYHYHPTYVGKRLLASGLVVRNRSLPDEPVAKRVRRVWNSIQCRITRSAKSRNTSDHRSAPRLTTEWPNLRAFFDWARQVEIGPHQTLALVDGATCYGPATVRVVEKADVMKAVANRNRPPPKNVVTAFGETKGVAEWARDPRCRVCAQQLSWRIHQGIEPESAITTPKNETLRRGRNQGARVIRPKSNVDWERARELYSLDGASMRSVAEALGVRLPTIVAGFRRLGIAGKRKPGLTRSEAGHRLNKTWRNLLTRLKPQTTNSVGRHGACDLVCDEWKTFGAFHDWAIANGWKPGLLLVRIEKDQPFSPANSRFVARNDPECARGPMRSANPSIVVITAFGETKGAAEWARDPRCMVELKSLVRRIRGGEHPEDAITRPPASAADGRTPTRIVEAFGESKSLADWARDPRCRVVLSSLWNRLGRGMSPEEAITKPSRFQTRRDEAEDEVSSNSPGL